VAPEAAARAEAWDRAWPGGPLVFLAPGARWATKRWPEASYLEVARRLAGTGRRVLLGGDAADRATLPGLARWAEDDPRGRWFAGGLADLAAVVQRAERALTNDSGLMHLAAAVGVRTVAVFGSTHPALGFAPAGAGHTVLCANLACQPCTLHGRGRCPLGHHRCVHRFTPDDALAGMSLED
jgi:heptosyltransferase-2